MTQEANIEAQKKGTILIKDSDLRRRSSIDCSRPILTEQSHKELTNINVIMENYVKTGMLPGLSGSPMLYVDDTQRPTFEEAHNVITAAKIRFDQLPTSLKNELSNDYRKLESWLSNPENHDRAVKMGLLLPKKQATPEPEPKVKTPEATPAPALTKSKD